MNKEQEYNFADLSKFVLSIVVCVIHSLSDIEFIRPWISIAVPVFFTLSGFFFFKKWDTEKNTSIVLREIFLPFFKRNSLLYLVWFIIWLPELLPTRGWFEDGILRGFFVIIIRIVLNSTFTGSWFISALVIDVLIVCVLGRWIENKIILILSAVLYCICVLMSNYRGMFSEVGILQRLFVYTYPGTFYNSFPAGLFFVAFGKFVADKRLDCRNKVNWLRLVSSLVFLYAEYRIIILLDCRVDDDCYFSLLLFAPLLTVAVLSSRKYIKNSKLLRNLSTINFCMHGGVIVQLTRLLDKSPHVNSIMYYLLRFAGTEVICLSFGMLVLFLENKKRFGWLKYLH